MIKLLLIFLVPLTASASEIKVKVKGMVCGFCAQGIDKKFSADSAIEDVKVDLESQTVTLALKDGKDLEDGEIRAILRDAGFTPGRIERSVSKRDESKATQ